MQEPERFRTVRTDRKSVWKIRAFRGVYFDAHGSPVDEDDHWTDEEGMMWAVAKPARVTDTPYHFQRVDRVGHAYVDKTGNDVKWNEVFTDAEGKHWTFDAQSRARAMATTSAEAQPGLSAEPGTADGIAAHHAAWRAKGSHEFVPMPRPPSLLFPQKHVQPPDVAPPPPEKRKLPPPTPTRAAIWNLGPACSKGDLEAALGEIDFHADELLELEGAGYLACFSHEWMVDALIASLDGTCGELDGIDASARVRIAKWIPPADGGGWRQWSAVDVPMAIVVASEDMPEKFKRWRTQEEA